MADILLINHRQKRTLNKEKCPAILFNGPFKLIPTRKIPFLRVFFSGLWLARNIFKWFMSYYNTIQTYIICCVAGLEASLKENNKENVVAFKPK